MKGLHRRIDGSESRLLGADQAFVQLPSQCSYPVAANTRIRHTVAGVPTEPQTTYHASGLGRPGEFTLTRNARSADMLQLTLPGSRLLGDEALGPWPRP